MKTRLLLAFSLLLMFFAASCNFTENITIAEDGSGSISMDMDASNLMALAGDELAKEGDKRIDSTFSFKDVFDAKKDSIAQLPKEEQDRLKKLEKFSMKMLMDPQTQEFKISLLNDFKKIDDLGDMMDAFEKASPMNNKKGAEGMPDFGFDKYKTKTAYFFNGKKFKKTVSRKDELPETENDSIEMFKAMLSGSTYTVNYKFPKRIKSVSNKTATLSADKKTVTVVYPFSDYLDKPKDMSIEVEFEK